MPSGLPSGPPSGKGLSVPQDKRPALQTYSKPEGDIRTPDHGSDSIYRVEYPDGLGKKDQPVPDERQIPLAPRFTGPGPQDSSPKTKAPYRDNKPNSKLAWRYMMEMSPYHAYLYLHVP